MDKENEWTKKTHTMAYYLAIKSSEELMHSTTRMNLGDTSGVKAGNHKRPQRI